MAKKTIAVRMDPALHLAVKKEAVRREVSIEDIYDEAMRQVLKAKAGK